MTSPDTATAAPTAIDPSTIPLKKLARMYIKMREKMSELTREYDTATEIIKAQQAIVASTMKDRVRAMGEGVNSVKTEHGTIMLRTTTRYYATDWEAFGAFVVAQGDTSLLEKRVAQGNMSEFLKNNPTVTPPGLNSISEIEVSVRKPSAK